jgi:uncharacterized membrane protein
MLPESPTDDAEPERRLPLGARPIGLGLILLCLGATLILGAVSKVPCASGVWTGQQYTKLCYTDIVPLLATEQLPGGRLPFFQPCVQTAANCDEYPVLTMYLMRMAAWVSDTDYPTYFGANVALLWLAAIVTTISLYAVVGNRALYFALAPTLLVYGVMNWDLLAVALATAAMAAFFVRRDVLAGVLLGLGASAKFYPAMLVVPLIAQRLQDREPDRAIRLGWAAVGSYLALNLPFFIASPSSWLTFFRFNSERCADFDSLWSIAWRHRGLGSCPPIPQVNLLSAAAFVLVFGLVWFAKTRLRPGFPRWTLAFPLIVVFLLTNKVYSPQYGLWLLPLFALALPNLWAFIAFSVTDVAVFVTRFTWFGHFTSETYQWRFERAVIARTVVLLVCLVIWVLRRPDPLTAIAQAAPGPMEPAIEPEPA